MASGRSEEENLPIENTADNAPAKEEEAAPDKKDTKEEPSNAPQPTPEPQDDKKKDSKGYEEDMLAMIEHFQNMTVDPLGDALADKVKDAAQDFLKWYRSKDDENKEEAAPEEEKPEEEVEREAQEEPTQVEPTQVESGEDLEADTNLPNTDSQERANPELSEGASPEAAVAQAALSQNEGTTPSPKPSMMEGDDSPSEAKEQEKIENSAQKNEDKEQAAQDLVIKAAVISQGGDAATAEQVSGMVKKQS